MRGKRGKMGISSTTSDKQGPIFLLLLPRNTGFYWVLASCPTAITQFQDWGLPSAQSHKRKQRRKWETSQYFCFLWPFRDLGWLLFVFSPEFSAVISGRERQYGFSPSWLEPDISLYLYLIFFFLHFSPLSIFFYISSNLISLIFHHFANLVQYLYSSYTTIMPISNTYSADVYMKCWHILHTYTALCIYTAYIHGI